MTILFSTPCMASSATNTREQLQASTATSAKQTIYYNTNITTNYNNIVDDNQRHRATITTSTNRQIKTTTAPIDTGPQEAHMPHDGGDKPLVHPANYSSLASNYDGYIAGMSSDSELTPGGTTTRHHHYYNHRPYSSQSRVYHAHPVPKGSPASSRVSHYSDSAVLPQNVQSSSSASVSASATPPTLPAPSAAATNSFAIHQHQQIQPNQQKHPQHPISNQAVSMTSNANQISLNHQGSISSSGSASSSYLGGVVASESPLSPIMHHHQQQQQQQQVMRGKSGRQLPQRPFKQSMSIDHQSIGGHQYKPMNDGSPVHHSSLSSHRNLAMDQVMDPTIGISSGGYQQQNYAPLSHQQPQHFSPQTNQYVSGGGVAVSPRSLRMEMALMEKQAANMNIYDPAATIDNPTARLPPTGSSRPSSSSSSRQLPSVSSNDGQGMAGSLSLDQQHHQINPFHQQQQQHQDPYANHQSKQQQQQQQHHHQLGSASTEWLPPVGSPSQHNPTRSTGHFKQTMSIDHYTGLHHNQHQVHHHQQQQQQQQQQHQQQQQQQYSPARGQHFVGEHYNHQIGTYSSPLQPLIGNYDSTPSAGPAGGSVGADQAYYSAAGPNQEQPEQQESYYQSLHKKQQQINEQPGQQQQQQPLQHQQMSLDYSNANIRGPPGRTPLAALQSRQVNRPTLHHQLSSSSSNSNHSVSLKSSNLDDGTDKQTSAEHQTKSITSTTSAGSPHYHHQSSPQHKMVAGASHRPDMLRRGYTSLTMGTTYGGSGGGGGGGGGDLGDSLTALSETGDMSSALAAANQGQTGLLGGKRPGLRAASPSMGPEASSGQVQQSHHHQHQHHHNQHHSSSSAHGGREGPGVRSESSTGLPNGSDSNSTLTRKSNSTTQLSMTGSKKRLGFRKKQVTSFSVHRSEEVAPLEARHLVKQGSSVSEGDSSISGDSSSRSWSNSNFKQQTSEELASMSFIDGLGKGQMISRQGLASPYLGDIQLSLCDRRGNLEVEVIRARNLQAKTNKVPPLIYVKLYLVKNRKCLAKAKTTLSNKKTLNPLFQQQLTFHEDYHGCILQSIVWGNFGKMDKKNFMGIAQISIDDLELSDTVISWYKLFLPSSLQTLPSKSLRHTLLSNSTESFTNTNNSASNTICN